MSRKVRVYSTISNTPTQIITTHANDSNELLNELSSLGLYSNNMNATVKETNMRFTKEADCLPVGIGKDRTGNITNDYDFTLVITASKMDSGANNVSDIFNNGTDNIINYIKERLEELRDELNQEFEDTGIMDCSGDSVEINVPQREENKPIDTEEDDLRNFANKIG